jgi:hypothetical protein
MDFISKVIDINGEEFISLKELRIIGTDINKINLMFDCYKTNAYKIMYLSAQFDPYPWPVPRASDEYRSLLKSFLQKFVNNDDKAKTQWLEEMPTSEYFEPHTIIMTYCTADNHEVVTWYSICPNNFLSRLPEIPIGNYFPISIRLHSIANCSDHKIYFRLADIQSLLPNYSEAKDASLEASFDKKNMKGIANYPLDVQDTDSIPEAQNITVPDEKMTAEAFVQSLSREANDLWKEIVPGTPKDKSYKAALIHLESLPDSKIILDDIKLEFFKYSEKPKRSILGLIVQAVLKRNGYGLVGQAKIEGYLKNS